MPIHLKFKNAGKRQKSSGSATYTRLDIEALNPSEVKGLLRNLPKARLLSWEHGHHTGCARLPEVTAPQPSGPLFGRETSRRSNGSQNQGCLQGYAPSS